MRERNSRQWRHWQWLVNLPPARYRRAVRLWQARFGVRPCGFVCAAPDGQTGLNLIRD